MSNLKEVKKKISIIKSDILNLNKIKTIDNVDCLFHLAAKTSVLESIKNPKKYFKVNYKGTKSVMDFIKRSRIKKIIFSASASCYGNTKKLPTNEKQKIENLSEFGVIILILRRFHYVSPQTEPWGRALGHNNMLEQKRVWDTWQS